MLKIAKEVIKKERVNDFNLKTRKRKIKYETIRGDLTEYERGRIRRIK